MKHYADSYHCDVQFSIHDWVLVHLRPYRQTSLSATYTKLAKRLYGPFQIEEHIDQLLYNLKWPNSSHIHLVFHVSLLKPHQGPPPVSQVCFPSIVIGNHQIIEPLSILDWKWDESITPPTKLVLVQWVGLPLEDTT